LGDEQQIKQESLVAIYQGNLTKIFSSIESLTSNTVYLLLTNFYASIVRYLESDNVDRCAIALNILNDPLIINYNKYLYNVIVELDTSSTIKVLKTPKVFKPYSHFQSVSEALIAYRFDNQQLI